MSRTPGWVRTFVLCLTLGVVAHAEYTNFESSHVHPIALTPSGSTLLAVNTPDALLERFAVGPNGDLTPTAAIPVGLEPVSVAVRSETEVWVVNNLSDTISVVDLVSGVVVRTLEVGDEPTDVVFTATHAFVAVSQEDAVKRFELANLDGAPTTITLAGRDVRALAVSPNDQQIYAIALRSGNRTTVVNAKIIFGPNNSNLNALRLAALGLADITCSSAPPSYPPLPGGIARNPTLTDPPASVNPASFPPVGLIVSWDDGAGQWRDSAAANWNACLPYRLPDHDLFVIETNSLAVTTVASLGTLLFDLSVHPVNGKIYVSNTEARNTVRFEHALGLKGHVVDNRITVVDPAAGNAVTPIDLNAHINRASDPATNAAERQASVSQPGMLVWDATGSHGYLTALGSRKVFRVDGACLAASCVLGPNRAAPAAVEVGEGPSGVALLESKDRLYVLNRISHSISVVAASTLTELDEIPLHDPSAPTTRLGRRFLYDAVDLSQHGDASCASCHPSSDMDGLAWDLGDPTGTLVPYTEPLDNVRFVVPQGGQPVECDASFCAAHDGFDPQKGPMVTQTLRGMLEPLHWRGDRATMNEFNPAFVGLLGALDVGPINGKAAGLNAVDMELFRQFALAVALPPNPYRNVDDTTPCGPRSSDPGCEVQPHGLLFPGNPTEGALLFDTHLSDSGQPCVGCHAHPFGAAGGALGGVTPTEPPSSTAAALFFGTADGSLHSDLKIPHLRNIYDKIGPETAAPAGSPPDTINGFGLTHDGSFPDLYRFLALNNFTLSESNQAREVRDLASFMFHFPTSTRPAVGRQVTVPAGAAPTGTPAAEALLATLVTLGDGTDSARHCDLVATTLSGGRQRAYRLAAGLWNTDAAADPAVALATLRGGAAAALTFTCTPIGSGPRLGGDRDEDGILNDDDCAAALATVWAVPSAVGGLLLDATGTTELSWDDQGSASGPGTRYDIVAGDLSVLRSVGLSAATACVAAGVQAATYTDALSDPPSGDGYYYLLRARNACGDGGFGVGRESLAALDCMP